jgi:hypothetical protein
MRWLIIALLLSDAAPQVPERQVETREQRLERLCREYGLGPPIKANIGKGTGPLCGEPEQLPQPKPSESETLG